MLMFTVRVEYDGTNVVASLRDSQEAHHATLLSGGASDRVRRRAPLDGCLGGPATAAAEAVVTLMDNLCQGTEVWTAELCGCERHSAGQMEPLFDVVRGASEG